MSSRPTSGHKGVSTGSTTPPDSRSIDWSGQPRIARAYVFAVVVLGTSCFMLLVPRALPHPALFAFTLLAACVTSVWKVNLPLPFAGSTLSVSFAADMMALMLLGPELALIIAVAGVWVQCTVNVKDRQPTYRTIFSVAAEAVTMTSTGLAYRALGGALVGAETALTATVAKPAAAAFLIYFFTNTWLVAGAIALSTDQGPFALWRREFLWSAASFMVAGATGAAAAIAIARGQYWSAVLFLVPVYLVYWTYGVFVRRLAAPTWGLGAQPQRSNMGLREQTLVASETRPVASPHGYAFGPFTLDTRKRRLWNGGQLVALTPKAFDTLLVLVTHAGDVVSRDDLLRTVWPDTFVTEETLTQNIATIRRALGDSAERPQYIATVPRRGYRFIGIVSSS